jgi:hypothetical protein
MAVPQTDKDVDACIADVQAALDRLKKAQAADDEAYSEGDMPREKQPKSFGEARIRVREHFRKARGQRADSDD